VFYAYDIGMTIDLNLCEKKIASMGQTTVSGVNRRAPKCFDFDPQPLSLIQQTGIAPVASYKVQPSVSLTFYDFGAISLSYQISCPGNLDELLDLSFTLSQNNLLLTDSRNRASDLICLLNGAIAYPNLSPLFEDYCLFEIEDFECSCPAEELPRHADQALAQILRGEYHELSRQEIADALLCQIAFGKNELTLIDWKAAIVFDRDADDIRAVLEFANVELLEMRFLDRTLDTSLDRSFAFSQHPPDLMRWIPGWTSRNLSKISQMQFEAAILFERVSNAPKLLGDQFLARVYRLAAQRFHLGEWNSGILRKLDTIENFYQQLHDDTEGQRLIILEWIVIILIALEIVLPFFPAIHPGK
jgi:hypothetical protein